MCCIPLYFDLHLFQSSLNHFFLVVLIRNKRIWCSYKGKLMIRSNHPAVYLTIETFHFFMPDRNTTPKRYYRIYIKQMNRPLLWNPKMFWDFMKKTTSHYSVLKLVSFNGIYRLNEQKSVNMFIYFFSSVFSTKS